MEGIRGKRSFHIDAATLAGWLAAYRDVQIDIGTGDGRYVRHVAQVHADHAVIGLDACRENLRVTSRAAPGNALYVISDARSLPRELYGLAARITINFPWGSLLTGLLEGESALLDGLEAVARPGATLELRLNGGALSEAGWNLEEGAQQVRRVLRERGFVVGAAEQLDSRALRACPTTWARRLAFGRDPRALYLRAVRPIAPRSSTRPSTLLLDHRAAAGEADDDRARRERAAELVA